MIRYALRTMRTRQTGVVKVCDPFPVRESARDYIISRDGLVDALQCFRSRREALEAGQHERLVKRYALRSPDVLRNQLRKDLIRLRKLGWSHAMIELQFNMDYQHLRNQLYGLYDPSPRIVARVHIIARIMETAVKEAKKVLPPDKGCGLTPRRQIVPVSMNQLEL